VGHAVVATYRPPPARQIVGGGRIVVVINSCPAMCVRPGGYSWFRM